jgi:hypothetical protein
VRPELEELPPAPEQRIEGGRIVVPETAPDEELMCSCDNVHRVQLQAPDIADEVEDAGLVGRRPGACKVLTGDGQASRLGLREAENQAPTMKTGVPVSTLVKSDSASGIFIRIHPCEAE